MAGRGADARAFICCKLLLSVLLVVCATARAPIALADAVPPDNPIGAHSMLYSNSPAAFKTAMFSQAAAMGASEIRVDVDLSAVYPTSAASPDWTSVDQYISLAAAYHIRVLADVTATPGWLASCSTATEQQASSYECGTNDPSTYGQLVGSLAAHARGYIDDYEIISEPDGSWSYTGTPQQYAWMLSDAYQAVHAADPGARVLLGGLMGGSGSEGWAAQVFATPGADAARSFDVANVHIRDRLASLGADVTGWRSLFASYGFNGPLWVTEHGYPSDPAYQYDPAFRGTDSATGDAQQADYLTRSVPALVGAGANKVFVTERDNLQGQYASEGFLSGQVSDPTPEQASYTVLRKPAFYALQSLATFYASQLANQSRGARQSAPAPSSRWQPQSLAESRAKRRARLSECPGGPGNHDPCRQRAVQTRLSEYLSAQSESRAMSDRGVR